MYVWVGGWVDEVRVLHIDSDNYSNTISTVIFSLLVTIIIPMIFPLLSSLPHYY